MKRGSAFRRRYGALRRCTCSSLLASFALPRYAGVRLLRGRLRSAIACGSSGAAVLHDLVLLPLYAARRPGRSERVAPAPAASGQPRPGARLRLGAAAAGVVPADRGTQRRRYEPCHRAVRRCVLAALAADHRRALRRLRAVAVRQGGQDGGVAGPGPAARRRVTKWRPLGRPAIDGGPARRPGVPQQRGGAQPGPGERRAGTPAAPVVHPHPDPLVDLAGGRLHEQPPAGGEQLRHARQQGAGGRRRCRCCRRSAAPCPSGPRPAAARRPSGSRAAPPRRTGTGDGRRG